jgi:hypothetical protein
MTRTLASLAAIAVLALGQAAVAAPATQGRTQTQATVSADEVSAVRKHRRARTHLRVYGPHVYGWDAPVAWRGSDPSRYYHGYARARASGRCVVDLGYGRYEYCGW